MKEPNETVQFTTAGCFYPDSPCIRNGRTLLSTVPILSLFIGLMLLAMSGNQTVAGILTLERVAAPDATANPRDLTTLGTSDWAYWAKGGVLGAFNHKATGENQISDLTLIGTGHSAIEAWDKRRVVWTDGAPEPGATNEIGFSYTEQLESGFSFTVSADTSPKTLHVFAGGFQMTARLVVSLSDGSAVAITNDFEGSQSFENIYTVNFQADSPGQTLTVTYTKVGPGASLDLMAAWLTTAGTLAVSHTAAADATTNPRNLTLLGGSDWAYWAQGGILGNFNNKATGGGKISDLSFIGSGHSAIQAWDKRRVAWTDGAPLESVVNEIGFAYTEQLDSGFSFTVQATTNLQTLYVFAGGFQLNTRLVASLSDDSVPAVTNDYAGVQSFERIYAINFKSFTPNQTLTVTYTKISEGASLDLMAAWLVSGNPPEATITSPVNGATFTIPTNILITANAVGGSGIASVQFMDGTNLLEIDTTSPYSATLTDPAIGVHNLRAVAVDTVNSYGTSAPVTITVFGNSGQLTRSVVPVAYASQFDLTALGVDDWAHWGRGGVHPAFDHKASGGGQVSDITPIGGVAGFADSSYQPRLASWSDGSPTASVTDDYGFLSVSEVNDGFSFTVPADTSVRTIYILAGGLNSAARLRAALSDLSAVDVVDVRGSGDTYQNVYGIAYRAASAGQSLTVTLTKDSGAGTVHLKAAWLNPGLPPTYELAVANGTGSGSYFSETPVPIAAETPPANQVFDQWVVNSGNPTIQNIYAPTTTLTTSASAASVTATYRSLPAPGLFVQGINLNGPAVTIEGNDWISYDTALAEGFTAGNFDRFSTIYDFALIPEPDNDTRTMLESLLFAHGNVGFTMNVNVNIGYYDVYLWIIENNVDNFRAMDIAIQGVPVATNVGRMPKGEWLRLGPYPASVTEGVMTIQVSPNGTAVDPLACGLAFFTAAAPVEAPQFTSIHATNGSVTLDWNGAGELWYASTVNGPWTLLSATPAKPYSEPLTTTNRFYQLKRP